MQMTQEQAAVTRAKLLARLAGLGTVLRGSLLERTAYHSGGCPKCVRGEGHPPMGSQRRLSRRKDAPVWPANNANRTKRCGST